MPIITFWNNGREQVGKTISLASVVTELAIEHNKKILIISTSLNDNTLKDCYWENNSKARSGLSMLTKNNGVGLENGIDGLVKILRSNKITPNIIKDYTKIVFKERLEVLLGFYGNDADYKEIQDSYLELIKLANQYYDYVFVDLDYKVNRINTREILRASNVIVMGMSQRMRSIHAYLDAIEENDDVIDRKKVIPLLCRYDRHSKYTAKNVTRFLNGKKEINTVPYSTLLFESSEEGKIVDYFLKIRKIDETDKNAFFLNEVKKTAEAIDYKIQELQMR